jgi:hypothetical protein
MKFLRNSCGSRGQLQRNATALDFLLLLSFLGISIGIHGAGVATIGDMMPMIWVSRAPLSICVAWTGVLWLLFAHIVARTTLRWFSMVVWIVSLVVAVAIAHRSLGPSEYDIQSLAVFFVVVVLRSFVQLLQLARIAKTLRFRTLDLLVFVTISAVGLAVILTCWDRTSML